MNISFKFRDLKGCLKKKKNIYFGGENFEGLGLKASIKIYLLVEKKNETKKIRKEKVKKRKKITRIVL